MLQGAVAQPVLGLNQGVRNMVPMLHLTRTWNAVSASAVMRRGLALARDYAQKRSAFGSSLAQKPLHADTLARLQAEFEAAFHLTFYGVALIGKDEAGEINEDEALLLRLLTSINKLVTGRQAVALSSEILEAHGGAGYVEDTGLPMLLRDAQVLPIWEGTTNVLSLDTLRALREGDLLTALGRKVGQCAQTAKDERLRTAVAKSEKAMAHAQVWLAQVPHQAALEAGARRLALTLGRALQLALLVEHAQWSLDEEGDGRARAAACLFAQTTIDLIIDEVNQDEIFALVDDESTKTINGKI
jgi:hypothetical protein